MIYFRFWILRCELYLTTIKNVQAKCLLYLVPKIAIRNLNALENKILQMSLRKYLFSHCQNYVKSPRLLQLISYAQQEIVLWMIDVRVHD